MEESSIENNIERNQYGGWYVNGKEFSTEKKVECEETYRRLCAQNGRPPSIRAFAKEAKVSRKFAKKMMEEIKSNGHVVSVESLKKKRHEENPHLRGVGAQKLSPHEKQILIDLRHDDPSRSNIGYVAMLHQISGTKVSTSFVTNFFKEIGPYKAKLRKVPLIPIDKHRPKNIKTYQDASGMILLIVVTWMRLLLLLRRLTILLILQIFLQRTCHFVTTTTTTSGSSSMKSSITIGVL